MTKENPQTANLAKSRSKKVIENTERPQKLANSKFLFKFFILIALLLSAYIVFLVKYNSDYTETESITLSPPDITQDETISSDEVSNTIAEFISPGQADNMYFDAKQEDGEDKIADYIKEEELEQILNHLKYLEQKVQKLESHVYSGKAIIEKEYRTILSHALSLDRKVQTGEKFNRELILLQLETDDVFINGKIADISEFAVEGTPTVAELSLEFAKLRESYTERLQLPIASSSAIADAFDGLITIKRKYKIPEHIAANLDLIQEAINKSDLQLAAQHFAKLPQQYRQIAANFAYNLRGALIVRKSVDEILRYLDV